MTSAELIKSVLREEAKSTRLSEERAKALSRRVVEEATKRTESGRKD